MTKYITWVDLETSGSDERADSLLEVAAILTDDQLTEISRIQMVVRTDFIEDIRALAPEVVRRMHDANGLWLAVANAHSFQHVVDARLDAWLTDHTSGADRVALAGSGAAHFDGRWLRYCLPRFAERLTYWAYDIGVIRRYLELSGAESVVKTYNTLKTHRAMDDIELHLTEGRYYRWLLGLLPAVIPAYEIVPPGGTSDG